jgi:Fanconi anemia group M protein
MGILKNLLLQDIKMKHPKETHPSTKTVRWIQHPLINPEKIEARLYQQVLAANVIKKGNTMIVAPTALGKTIVAALVAAERIKKYPDSKILLLAPTKPLVVQHEETFRNFLKTTTSSLTGAIKLEERVKRWYDSQIICATPQTIESDIIAGRYSLKDVSLLIFDECHRGTGSYSYVFLANRYTQKAENPLILGLTASPGGDEDRIQQVCQNFSSMKWW